jgi:hypothetical protein
MTKEEIRDFLETCAPGESILVTPLFPGMPFTASYIAHNAESVTVVSTKAQTIAFWGIHKIEKA